MFILNYNLLFKIGISLIFILFCKIISSFIAYILIKMFHLKEKDKNKIKKNAFYKPIKIFIVLIAIYDCTFLFVIPTNIKKIIIKAFRICVIFLFAKGFANLFNTNSESFNKIREKFNFHGNDTLVNFTSKILKGLVYIFAGFGLIAFAWMAIFGKISWKWFANISIGLFLVAVTGMFISYFTGDKSIADDLDYGYDGGANINTDGTTPEIPEGDPPH